MRELIKPTIRTWVMMLPIFAGVWIYSRGSETMRVFNGWLHVDKKIMTIPLSGGLADYVWSLLLLAGIVLLRKSWHKISVIWKLSIWILVSSAASF